jgi:hypothetical protein
MVLCVGAVTLRHGVLVRATSRAAEDHLPFAVIAAGVAAGLLMALTASGVLRRWGIAIMILIPLVIVLTYTIGLQFDPQAITAARANQLGRAIEDYFWETGEYPSSLGYYAYPDDTPFWEPYYEIKVPYSAGLPPEGEWICDEELQRYKQHGGL